MRRAYLVVEGNKDADFVKRVLPDDALNDVEVVVADGRSGISSLVRTFASARRRPIAALMNAETTEPDSVREKLQNMDEMTRLGTVAVPMKIVAAVPVIEAWFFAAPEAIARVLGQPIPSDFLPFGKMDPKGVLQHFAQKAGKQWDTAAAIRQLDAADIAKIRAVPEVAELSAFLAAVRADEKAA